METHLPSSLWLLQCQLEEWLEDLAVTEVLNPCSFVKQGLPPLQLQREAEIEEEAKITEHTFGYYYLSDCSHGGFKCRKGLKEVFGFCCKIIYKAHSCFLEVIKPRF